MEAQIINYCLCMKEDKSKGNGIKFYESRYDSWILNEKDISMITELIRDEIKHGEKPIVTVFLQQGIIDLAELRLNSLGLRRYKRWNTVIRHSI